MKARNDSKAKLYTKVWRTQKEGYMFKRGYYKMKSAEDTTVMKKKRKSASNKYNYSFGEEYPVSKKKKTDFPIGPIVPANMGWLWNVEDITGKKPQKKWQPGSVGKTIAQMMNFKSRGVASASDKSKKKKKKSSAKEGMAEGDAESDEEPLEPKPTLKVRRKGDMFTILVNPLKDLTEILPNEDPYVDCDPLVFKIVKQRSPEEKAKVEARRLVKLKKARDFEIRQALADAVEDICKCAYMDVYCNDYSAIDKVINTCPAFEEPKCTCESESLSSLSSNATWDIEYTPPFGCFDLSSRKRKHFIHIATQYSKDDAGMPEPTKKKVADKVVKIEKPNKRSKGRCKPCCQGR